MSEEPTAVELSSFGEGGIAIGMGLLGATGRTYEEAKSNRLAEIERRILAIEAMVWPLGR